MLKLAMGIAVGVVLDVTLIVAVPACTQPLAVVTLGVVAPVGKTPPTRYQTSAFIVPVLKVFEKPVTKMLEVVVISNVMAVEPLFGVRGGIVVIVVWPETLNPSAMAKMGKTFCSKFFILLIKF